MTRLIDSRRSISIPLFLATLFLFSARAAAEESASANSEEGPLLIALAPKKSESKKYDLRYKFKRGEVLRYEVTDRASFNTTIEQSTEAAQTKTVTVKAWKIIDVLPNGNIEFISVIDRLQMVNQLPDRDPTEYDSASDKMPPPGFEDVAKSVGVPLIAITMTPRGEVLRRNWKLRAPRGDDNAPIALRLPEKPIVIGDTWNELIELQVTTEGGEAKTIQTRRHHKLANVANDVATIEVDYQVLSPMDSVIEYQLVQRLMKGEVRFDLRAGRVIGQKMDVDKRILGFAGPTSSTHYVMRMEEKLLKAGSKVVGKPARKATASQNGKSRSQSARTATRPQTQQRSRTSRR